MKSLLLSALAVLALTTNVYAAEKTAAPAPAAEAKTTAAAPRPALIGIPAPNFEGMDTNGKKHKLSDFKGKTVVLEWTNPDCPYVHKHYETGNMQKLQKEATDDGVVWLTIASSAVGKEGFYSAEESNKWMAEKKSAPTARILDPVGTIGHLYGAKTTPHMFVINSKGILVYTGAIDDNDSFKKETIATSKNYVREALKDLKEGKKIETPTTKPYGCSVKYAN